MVPEAFDGSLTCGRAVYIECQRARGARCSPRNPSIPYFRNEATTLTKPPWEGRAGRTKEIATYCCGISGAS
jgi:hypothetical protein